MNDPRRSGQGSNPCSGPNFSGHTRYFLSSAKNCEDHSPSLQSTALTHGIHVFTSYIQIKPLN